MRIVLLAKVSFVLAFYTTAISAPPDVKSVFPMGATIGTTTALTASGSLGQAGTKVWFSEPGISVDIPETNAPLNATIAADARPGLTWMRFYNSEGATPLMPFVLGTLQEILDTEPNNTIEKAQKIGSSLVVNGTLAENGDVDVFGIQLKAGQTLVASLDANWMLGSPLDGILQLLSPDGAVIEQNDDDHGQDPLVTLTTDRDMVCFVRLFGFPAAPDSSIRHIGGANYRYRLTLTTGSFLTHATPSVVDPTQKLRLAGWNLTEETSLVNVSNSNGTTFGGPLFANTIKIDNSTINVTFDDASSSSAKLQIGGVACGVIAKPKEIDVYTFRATKGQILVLDVESRSLGLPLDATLVVASSDGKPVLAMDDSPGKEFDPNLKFTAPADGDYTVSVSDAFRNGGWRYAYRLYLRENVPTFALSSMTDTFLLTEDNSLEIPIVVTRIDGFSDDVTFSLNGLPSGVASDPQVSVAKSETASKAKLTLTITQEAGNWSGPVRLVGKYGPGESKTIAATYALKAFSNIQSEHFWVTVRKKTETTK